MKTKNLFHFLRAETERRISVERDLNHRIRQQEAIAWFGEYALKSRDMDALFQQAVRLTAETLSLEMCKILELLPDGKELLLRAGIGWQEGLVGEVRVPAGKDSQAGYALLTDEPVIVADLLTETRFSGPKLLLDHQVVSGLSVIIPGKDRPFGVLGAHTKQQRTFTANDARFLKSIANVLASAIDRHYIEEELVHSRNELQAIVNGITEGITVQNLDGTLTYANQTAAETTGFSSAQELLETPLHEVMQKFELIDESGRPFPVEQLPGRRVLSGETRASAMVRFRSRETGKERWSIVDATPVTGPNGDVLQTVNIFRDVTDILRRERSQELLAEAGKLLASSLDYETTLENIANLAVNNLADWCTVHLISKNDEVYQLAVAHKDPSKVEMAKEYQKRYPPDWNNDSGIIRVLRTGRAEYFPEITDAMVEAGARDPEHLKIIRALGLRAAMIVPLIARGRTLGAITLIWSESGTRYTEEDIDLVNELAWRAAIAIDNARLYQEAQALNTELEQRVEKRTHQLEISNRQLLKEIEERHKAEGALRENETLLNSLFESAPDATILVNQEGKIIRVNRQAETVFGYWRDELVGKTIDMLLPDRFRTLHSHYRENYLKGAIMRPMGAGLSLSALRKDGTEFPIDVMLSPVQTSEGQLIISAVRDITEQKRLQTELSETHQRLFESIEAERLVLSQELHDGPIQELYGLALNLESLKGFLDTEEDLEDLAACKETLQSVIHTLREICGELRPPVLEQFGLVKAIRSHLMKVKDAHPEINIDAHLMPDGPWLPDRARLSLYRIYQNAINNTLRHAQAKNIQVSFKRDDGQIHLIVQDDGQGFNVPKKWVELAREGHFGLVGMAERVQWLEGQMAVESTPGRGTTIRVVIPLEKQYAPDRV